MSELHDILGDALVQRSLLAALLVGLSAPIVGTFLVQRRLSLLGDGIGHVALTGVALGWLVGAGLHVTPAGVLAVPGAVVAAIAGAVTIEIVRTRSGGDLALALLFYGGIAGGVLLIGIGGGTSANLMQYLFGSISTVTPEDLWLTATLSTVILAVGLGGRTALFTVSYDEEFAKASGLPVRVLNLAVAVVAALTVTVAMQVVGLLLVSALMIVPVAIAQLVAHSFSRIMTIASATGMLVCVVGLSLTFAPLSVTLAPGATIVVLAILVYLAVAIVRSLMSRASTAHSGRDPHPVVPDDVVIPAQGQQLGSEDSCSA